MKSNGSNDSGLVGIDKNGEIIRVGDTVLNMGSLTKVVGLNGNTAQLNNGKQAAVISCQFLRKVGFFYLCYYYVRSFISGIFKFAKR